MFYVTNRRQVAGKTNLLTESEFHLSRTASAIVKLVKTRHDIRV
jgi:hypothetical protein